MKRHAFLAVVLVASAAGCRSTPAVDAPQVASSRSTATAASVGASAAPPDRASWLRTHAARLELPSWEQDDLSDLEALRRVVGDARIVGLGEQSHGDGTTFRQKARMVRFLHERMGFDVLAFEVATQIDCDVAWQALRSKAGDDVANVQRCFYPDWSKTAQLEPLVRYIASEARGAHPLQIAGFDNTPRRATADNLRAEFRDAGSPEAADPAPWAKIRDTFFAMRDQKTSELPALREESFKVIARLRASLARRMPTDRTPFLEHELDGIENYLRFAIDAILHPVPEDDAGATRMADADNPRDRQMAENVAWLAEHPFAGRKILLWAASYHLMRGHDGIVTPSRLDYTGLETMGEHLAKRFGQDMVSVGFVANEGARSAWGERSYPIEPRPADALETDLTKAGFEHALLDLRTGTPDAAWLHEPFVACPLAYTCMGGRWDHAFDAMVFDRVMDPSVIAEATASPIADGGVADAH